ncbi:MAG: ABC transporter substrate-binding protein [Candidatus Rokubacteria bacterium]|nr:ABC transporter substrate-binding protein [Candidatus Rokubacteria bacterium]
MRRHWLVLAAVVAVAAVAAPYVAPARVTAQTKEVIFYGFGGTHERNMRTRVIPPFEKKHNVKVTYVTGTANSNFAKVRAQKDRPEGDVLWTNDVLHVVGKRLGLFDRIDPARVPNLKDLVDVAKDPDGIGVMQGFQAEGLQYNTKVYKEKGWPAPSSWYDLWKPELKGRVALYGASGAYMHYFIPFLARLEGGNERNVDGAFRKLKELAPAVLNFVNAPAELDNLIKQGEVWLTFNGSSRVYELAMTGFPTDFVYPKEGTILFGNWFEVVKGAPNAALAQEFVNYLVGAEAQELFAKHVFFGPVHKRTRLDADTAKRVPHTPDQLARLVKLDYVAMNEQLPAWVERFNKEIERR